MPRLRYKREVIPYHGSNPPKRWVKGDEEEVPEPEATRLLSTFPEWFESAEAAPVRPAVQEDAAPPPYAVETRQTRATPRRARGQ